MGRATTTTATTRRRDDATSGEPTKATVGDALRALDARARRMEGEARRERDARARDRDALARVAESVDALAAAFREAMEAISRDHDAWTHERREIKAAVEVAAAGGDDGGDARGGERTRRGAGESGGVGDRCESERGIEIREGCAG